MKEDKPGAWATLALTVAVLVYGALIAARWIAEAWPW